MSDLLKISLGFFQRGAADGMIMSSVITLPWEGRTSWDHPTGFVDVYKVVFNTVWSKNPLIFTFISLVLKNVILRIARKSQNVHIIQQDKFIEDKIKFHSLQYYILKYKFTFFLFGILTRLNINMNECDRLRAVLGSCPTRSYQIYKAADWLKLIKREWFKICYDYDFVRYLICRVWMTG